MTTATIVISYPVGHYVGCDCHGCVSARRAEYSRCEFPHCPDPQCQQRVIILRNGPRTRR